MEAFSRAVTATFQPPGMHPQPQPRPQYVNQPQGQYVAPAQAQGAPVIMPIGMSMDVEPIQDTEPAFAFNAPTPGISALDLTEDLASHDFELIV